MRIVIENLRKQINLDIEEERDILKKCQAFKDTSESKFDNIIREISTREGHMVQSVHKAAEKRRSKALKKKTEIKSVTDENTTRNGDILVTLRTKGMRQSKVVRFSGFKEEQSIQYDNEYNSFLSIEKNDVLFLTTNCEGDICVADWAGEAVVVFNALG
ncbi:uncharacterized protein LOC134256256 [Saccostrea cucullata]|uniref:uncharacterized protein LOC134256256 n=1 Tax=Saccostrea cuccullata TaxID=36930 RepID=UPI002ED452AB